MELPLPPHWDPEHVPEVRRVDYEQRARDAATWSHNHEIAPAREDSRRVCLLAVDVQNTFCTPEFELFVPGAPEDTKRLCEFVYRNLGAITEIVATLDTHVAAQIFHAAWLVDSEGRHPSPYTTISIDDVRAATWRSADPTLQEHLAHYVAELERAGRYRLTVWPYHAMLGGVGHALVSAFEEAVFFHAVARAAPTAFELKGRDPLTEHYSALGPEVTRGPSGEEIGTRNVRLVEHLLGFDAVVIAGQAKSHCVGWTVEDLLAHAPGLAERIYLLEDCTSPVVIPGVVDFSEEADAAFARFAAAGAHVVFAGDPLDTWPGFET